VHRLGVAAPGPIALRRDGVEVAGQEHERALAAFRRAAELDEFRESTRVSVVECLVRLGNRRAAVVEAERLRTLLQRELGVEPLPETERALERALGPSERPRKSLKESSNVLHQPIAPVMVVASAQAGLKSVRGH